MKSEEEEPRESSERGARRYIAPRVENSADFETLALACANEQFNPACQPAAEFAS